ncbi:MAG: polyprenyl synthetase family protein [Nocardioidaceae bacterium]
MSLVYPAVTATPRLADVSAPAENPDAEAVLRGILAEGFAISTEFGLGYQGLWTTLSASVEGGKRFRPALFATAYRAWGGTDDRSAAAVGAAIELLHTAFIVHDDVIDGDSVRRGRPNIAGFHAQQARAVGVGGSRARHYGEVAGILAGDLALVAALKAVATCPAPRPTVQRLMDLFDRVLHATAAGELSDVWLSLGAGPSALGDSLTMEERKTGVYSFALPLQAGAVLADAPDSMVEAVGSVGRSVGVAFQLVDDLHGVFGDPAVTGKSALSDLRSGKQTPLIAHARTTAAWEHIGSLVGRPQLTAGEARRVCDLLTECGSRRFVEDLASQYADGGLELALNARLPPSLVSRIRALTLDLIGQTA